MTDRARITIAALTTALFLGAISAAGALTHSHATLATTTSHARPAALSAPRATPFPSPDMMTND